MFAARFWKALARLSPTGPKVVKEMVRSIARSNVVLHSTVAADTPRSIAATELVGTRQRAQPIVQGKLIMAASASGAAGPFTHQRVHTKNAGKILLFSTGNVIRAGRHTHGDAVRGVMEFILAIGGWPTAMSVPNTVVSCQYKTPISEQVRNDWRAVCTTKFPGIAITFADIEATVELFMKKSNWIAPGVRSPEHLAQSMLSMCALWQSSASGSPTSADTLVSSSTN